MPALRRTALVLPALTCLPLLLGAAPAAAAVGSWSAGQPVKGVRTTCVAPAATSSSAAPSSGSRCVRTGRPRTTSSSSCRSTSAPGSTPVSGSPSTGASGPPRS